MPRIRDSGMPPLEQWERFFDPGSILEALGCRDLSGDVVEFGCGYGTFAIPAAHRASGTVYALDIDPLMVAATTERAQRAGTPNVVAERRDFVVGGCGRPACSTSYVMLFNILHLQEPLGLLQEAHRVLRPGAILGILHWKRDASTPRGPPLEMRPSAEQCRLWGKAAGFRWIGTPQLPGSPWHWGMMLARPPDRRVATDAGR
ncbi:MAG TPA: class I SAM-dependent methyltransferase [Steroidobacteraceae bacterium]|nr:class I SAM-dependent methyltransferase [Steroidobacteraceae bacterium]